MWGRSISANDPRISKMKKSNLGPGCYNPVNDFKPLYKYKQSAAFASDAPRAFFAKEKKRSLASRRTKVDEGSDEEDSEYIDDATPGPGYYHQENQSTFKKQYKDH
jgi:Sperm-tail PG-rich repeat